MRLRHMMTATLLAAGLAGPGTAATVLYSEGTDLSNISASPTALGNAPLGVSTVSGNLGSVSGSIGFCPAGTECVSFGIFDRDVIDAFSFVVPDGLKLVSAKLVALIDIPDFGFPPVFDVSVASLELPTPPQLSVPLSWSSTSGLLSGGPFTLASYELVPTNGALTGAQNLTLQLANLGVECPVAVTISGCGPITLLGEGFVGPTVSTPRIGLGSGRINWTVTLTTEPISPVPLPAGLPLLGAGLGLLAFLRARRTSA